MGITKTANYTEQQIETANLLKAIGHPARVAIIEFLLSKNTCICGDIVEELELAQATISQHLRELKTVNLIKGSIEGNSICYCLNEDTFRKIESYFSIFNQSLNEKKSCC